MKVEWLNNHFLQVLFVIKHSNQVADIKTTKTLTEILVTRYQIKTKSELFRFLVSKVIDELVNCGCVQTRYPPNKIINNSFGNLKRRLLSYTL